MVVLHTFQPCLYPRCSFFPGCSSLAVTQPPSLSPPSLPCLALPSLAAKQRRWRSTLKLTKCLVRGSDTTWCCPPSPITRLVAARRANGQAAAGRSWLRGRLRAPAHAGRHAAKAPSLPSPCLPPAQACLPASHTHSLRYGPPSHAAQELTEADADRLAAMLEQRLGKRFEDITEDDMTAEIAAEVGG